MGRSTVHYADNTTNNTLKKLHNKLRPAGTPVQRVEYIIELLLLRIFEAKLKHDPEFEQLRPIFRGENESLLFSSLFFVPNEQILPALNNKFFPFYARILSEARQVLKGNPSIKVQDQFVLIEEVFGNSNFTNNVTSGNLQEVISLVGELDEERLLKTDLLGDAIESSLSETGGTKDIGLYRTPDHIRQFMVGLVEPGFSDLILDPACGTGGFLFDAFEYVMESVTKDNAWPGPKTHPEMAEWFKAHFKKKKSPMPTIEATTDFYRNGVMGIEYLGMIRKMASINFYIRGLNPANIIQGDSLARFKKDFFPESKTAILANPPFGAERDQEAYPDVWSEYPKESETTILFVKLMLEALKKGGRCAVVVSEGFMTWDQGSARALRKSLLEDANLRAIISLPQGVFVSKGGQGPKTSILYFEKGTPTRHVWFYKVTNDGYTSGTNRKQVAGCQLTEAIDLFHRYVRTGKIPPDTRHSFIIPADWIKALDPRVKERIRTETTEELSAKAKEERRKLEESLTARLQNEKTTQQELDDRLTQHDQLWQGKISNEIARRIERAHLYSFNLPNYRSSLSQTQIKAWQAFAAEREPVTDETLDKQYARLKTAGSEELARYLSSFDPRNTLELDIARQFLTALAQDVLEKNQNLKTLTEIITIAAKYPRVKLKELIEPRYDRIKKNDYDGSLPLVEKISFGDGAIHFRDERETGMDLYKAKKGDLLTSKINIHQGAVAIVPCELAASTHYQMYEIHTEDANPAFIINILRSRQFYGLINDQKNKGIKNEQGADFLGEFEIPLPLILEEQEAIIAEIDRQQAIIEGAEKILANLELNVDLETDKMSPIGDAVVDTKNGWSPRCEGGDTPVLTLACLKNGRLDLSEVKYTGLTRDDIERFFVREGDFFYSRGNTPELVALAGMARDVSSKVVFPDLLTRVKFDENLILPEFAVYLFNSKIGREYFGKVPVGASPSMVKVSQDYMAGFMVPYVGNIPKQLEIIAAMEDYNKLIESLAKLKQQASDQITGIIEKIWEN
jgi:type I restriction-modification system DNA methylase subunit/restriction endonuclease S subunit